MHWWISSGDTSDGSKFIIKSPLKSKTNKYDTIAIDKLPMIHIIKLVNPVLTG
jgi:hypothetical protein